MVMSCAFPLLHAIACVRICLAAEHLKSKTEQTVQQQAEAVALKRSPANCQR